MANKVKYVKATIDGESQVVMLPSNYPDSFSEMGIPVTLGLNTIYPEPLVSRLETLLFERGLVSPEDFEKAGALEIIRQCIQAVVKLDANEIYNFVLKKGKYKND